MAHYRSAVARSQSKPSSLSPAPVSQPAESQESFNLDNVSGSDEPARGDHGDEIRVNDPDTVATPNDTITDIQYFFDKTGTEKVTCKVCL